MATRDSSANDDGDLPDEAAFWLGVSSVPHIGPVRIERLISRFGSLRQAWSAPEQQLAAVLESRPLTEFLAFRAANDPRLELEKLQSRGIEILYPGHPSYPRLLAEISGRPSVLFIRGRLTPADDNAVALVGTRRSTPYGRQAAEQIAKELAQAGVTIVSGLARGVDTVAHRAALSAHGRTVAVLGSGWTSSIPRRIVLWPTRSSNPERSSPSLLLERSRTRRIFPPGTVSSRACHSAWSLWKRQPAAARSSRRRLRPIKGERSLSSREPSFLRPAKEPTRFSETAPESCGAESDVLEDLGIGESGRSAVTQIQMPIDETEARILHVVSGESSHIDDIAERANFTAAETGAVLLTLELKGLVRNLGAQFYVKR